MKSEIAKAFLLLVVSLSIFLWWMYRPGGPENPHEWLNETMNREFAEAPGSTSVSLGHWHFDREAGLINYTDEETVVSVVKATKANYSMLKIDLTDGRCFVADYCLRHGEFALKPCEKGK
jgi:hypothetical protein